MFGLSIDGSYVGKAVTADWSRWGDTLHLAPLHYTAAAAPGADAASADDGADDGDASSARADDAHDGATRGRAGCHGLGWNKSKMVKQSAVGPGFKGSVVQVWAAS
jgi:hypothetical protein